MNRRDEGLVADGLEVALGSKVTEELEDSRKKVRVVARMWQSSGDRMKTVPTDWEPLADAIRRQDRPAMNRLMRELGLQVLVDFNEPDQRTRRDSIRVQVEVEVN